MSGAAPNMGRRLAWIALSLAVIALDQWTKALAQTGLTYHEPVALAPFLNLTLTFNPGAAFSFLGDSLLLTLRWQRNA